MIGVGKLNHTESVNYGDNPGTIKDVSTLDASFFVMPAAADPCLKQKSNIKSYEKFTTI